MTTCTYGASVKSGVDPDQWIPVSRATWEAATGGANSWLDFFLASLPTTVIKASALCALNLDDPPLPGVADIALALQGDYTASVTVTDYIRQKLEYYEFSQNCVCNPSHIDSVTCYQQSHPVYGDQDGWTFHVPAGTSRLSGVSCATSAPPFGPIPRYPKKYYGWRINGVVGWTTYEYGDASGVYWNVGDVALPAGFVAGRDDFLMYCESGSAGSTNGFEFNACAHSPNDTPTAPTVVVVPVQPPTVTLPAPWTCASDADICTRLNQIFQKLDLVERDVQLLQRWRLPFGYIPGTVHGSLTGAGTFAVSRKVGFEVLLTTPPPGGRVLSGNPPYVWDAGWMSITDAEGMLEEKRITRSGYVWLSGAAALATSFNYALEPGVMLQVTELAPEA